MKLLWDTHTFLWFINGSSSLSPTGRRFIEAPESSNYLSIASLWEIAIKLSIGKLTLDQPFDVLIPKQIAVNGIEVLPIKVEHLSVVATLTWHNKDPFDRLIVSQASVESMSLVSGDSAFDRYAVKRLW